MASELYADKQRPEWPLDTQIHVDNLQPLCSTLAVCCFIVGEISHRAGFLRHSIQLKGRQSTSAHSYAFNDFHNSL